MAGNVGRPLRLRIIDVETTGIGRDDHVVEIAAVDLLGTEIIPIGSNLIQAPIPIPPEASAVHHLTDEDVMDSPCLQELLPPYMDTDRTAGVDVFVAHNWSFEAQWLAEHLQGRPAICTYKAALQVWPDSPLTKSLRSDSVPLASELEFGCGNGSAGRSSG